MLRDASELEGLIIRAIDGELGSATEFYFDDDSWAIRYMVVETGGWLGGKKVLISPYSIVQTDWNERHVDVALTKKQVENSPGIESQLPVSRQHEVAYLGYYGYPYYWGGPYLWGPDYYPSGLAVPAAISQQDRTEKSHAASKDTPPQYESGERLSYGSRRRRHRARPRFHSRRGCLGDALHRGLNHQLVAREEGVSAARLD